MLVDSDVTKRNRNMILVLIPTRQQQLSIPLSFGPNYLVEYMNLYSWNLIQSFISLVLVHILVSQVMFDKKKKRREVETGTYIAMLKTRIKQ